MEQALAMHPGKFDVKAIRARGLAMVGGDGQIAPGGTQCRHSSSQACNKLHRKVYPTHACEHAEWEPFHRSETAFRAAVERCEMAQEMFAVGRAMSQQFGFGAGKVLLRAVAFELGENSGAACQVGGTRKGEALTRVAASVLHNFRTFAVGLHAKLKERRRGVGSGSQKALLVLGRRLLAVDFVTFTLGFSDTMRARQKPWTMLVQRAGELPWTIFQAHLKRQEAIHADLLSLREVRRLVTLLTLLQHYVDRRSLWSFMTAQLYTTAGKRWYEVVRSLFGIVNGSAVARLLLYYLYCQPIN